MIVRFGRTYRGFALPSVLITSVVAMMILMAALSSTVGIQTSLTQQYYGKLAREASESGVARAEECLEQNDYIATWTNAKPLTPKTDCNGNNVTSYPNYLLDDSNVKSFFEVGQPTNTASDKYLIKSNGKVSLLRDSDGSEWQSFTYDASSIVGGQINFATLGFGYYGTSGSFFGTVYPDGKVTAVGLNNYGQLGNGSISTTTTPTVFQLPAGEKAVGIYTNFLSHGRSIFVATESGNLYGTGKNSYGQLGSFPTSSRETTPVKFRIPTSVAPKAVAMLEDATFVIGDDNRIYTAGRCTDGVLGIGNSSCSYQTYPQLVALPTPDNGDLNTIPDPAVGGVQASNLVADRGTVFVRMKGGRVYGWGVNDYGQLGIGNDTNQSSPVQVGEFGDPGKSRAKKLAFDGDTLYVLDEFGDVYASGSNGRGTLAGAASTIRNTSVQCLTNPGNSTSTGTRLRADNCNSANYQLVEWTPDNELKFRPNGNVELCLENRNDSSSNGNPIVSSACNGSSSQKWVYEADNSNRIRNLGNSRCLDKDGSNQLQLYSCDGSSSQEWYLEHTKTPRKIPLPSGKKVKDISTDQWSVIFLMTDGTVYGAGDNSMGQLGSLPYASSTPSMVQFGLPSGAEATEIYTTRNTSIANTFVVLSNGDVYGVGSNTYGQLGNGTTFSYSYLRRQMALPSGVKAKFVQSGAGTTVVLTRNGKIYTVGNNSHGQLGDGTTTNRSTPRANQYTNDAPAILF